MTRLVGRGRQNLVAANDDGVMVDYYAATAPSVYNVMNGYSIPPNGPIYNAIKAAFDAWARITMTI